MSDYLIAHIGHSIHEHIVWWKPDERGYTVCIDKAGKYSETAAQAICRPGSCIAVTMRVALEFARGTPYYRLSTGDLARLYDGGEHRVVPNSKEAWKYLLAWRLDTEGMDKPSKPTPIGRKSRAIYLPKE